MTWRCQLEMKMCPLMRAAKKSSHQATCRHRVMTTLRRSPWFPCSAVHGAAVFCLQRSISRTSMQRKRELMVDGRRGTGIFMAIPRCSVRCTSSRNGECSAACVCVRLQIELLDCWVLQMLSRDDS